MVGCLRERLIGFGPLATVTVDRGIDDRWWGPAPVELTPDEEPDQAEAEEAVATALLSDCTVTVGTPGSPGATGGKSAGIGTTGAGPVTSGCAGTTNATHGCVPPGCTINTQTLACPLGVPGGPPGRARVPAPGVLAQLAVRYLKLPDPVIRSSPAPGALQLTQLPTWLWVAPAAWQPESRTATLPSPQRHAARQGCPHKTRCARNSGRSRVMSASSLRALID